MSYLSFIVWENAWISFHKVIRFVVLCSYMLQRKRIDRIKTVTLTKPVVSSLVLTLTFYRDKNFLQLILLSSTCWRAISNPLYSPLPHLANMVKRIFRDICMLARNLTRRFCFHLTKIFC